MDAVFLITTYNRQESCQRLVDSLQGLGDIIVLNDGCDYIINNCTQHFLTQHNGRYRYWETVRFLFNFRGNHKYHFMLPDDFLPKPNMVEETLRIWSLISDPNKICLNLHADRIGLSCWTRFKPIDMGEYYHTQWVDMCFFAEQKFFNIVHLWSVNSGMPNRSSGVGSVISTQLHRRGYGLYQVKEGLVVPQEEHWKSQMHSPEQENGKHNNRTRYHARPQREPDPRHRGFGRTGR